MHVRFRPLVVVLSFAAAAPAAAAVHPGDLFFGASISDEVVLIVNGMATPFASGINLDFTQMAYVPVEEPDDDLDRDGAPNASDTCPFLANDQSADADDDGIGDACDPRDDNDLDDDGFENDVDNCAFASNRNQADEDDDGIGDKCDDDDGGGAGGCSAGGPAGPSTTVIALAMIAALLLRSRSRRRGRATSRLTFASIAIATAGSLAACHGAGNYHALALPPTSKTTGRPVGITGPRDFPDACPAGAALVGFEGRMLTINPPIHGGLAARCAAIRVSDSPDAGPVEVGVPRVLPERGVGNSLIRWVADCPEQQLVVGFAGRAGNRLDELRLRCAPLIARRAGGGWEFTTGPITELPPIGGTGGGPFDPADCPPDQVATVARTTNKAGEETASLLLGCSAPHIRLLADATDPDL